MQKTIYLVSFKYHFSKFDACDPIATSWGFSVCLMVIRTCWRKITTERFAKKLRKSGGIGQFELFCPIINDITPMHCEVFRISQRPNIRQNDMAVVFVKYASRLVRQNRVSALRRYVAVRKSESSVCKGS